MRSAQVSASLILMFSLAILMGCNRPAKEEASVSFDLPKLVASEKLAGKTSVQSASDLKLNHVVINATASDIEAVFKAWESCHDGCANPELTGPFEFTLKSGPNRLIQILAVYKSPTTGEVSFYYGDVTADLNGGTVTLPIPVNPIAAGDVANGQISGRYLTGPDAGPTGSVDIKYNPGNGKPKLIVERGQITNGWFSLFGLAGVKMEYTVRESGLLLWGEPVDPLSNQMDPAFDSAANFSRLVRAYVPVHLRQEFNSSNGTTWELEDAGVYVWGYWAHGNNSALVSGKYVCTAGLSGATFTRMKKYALTPGDPLNVTRSGAVTTTYPTVSTLINTTSPLADVFVHGGGTSDMSSSCNGVSDMGANLFASFQKVDLAKLDGNGKDSLAGFRGVFIIDPSNGGLATVAGTPAVITGKLLPGTNAIFPAVRAYKRVAANQNYIERVDCRALPPEYVPAGTDSTTTGETFSLSTNISSADKAIGVSAILCPLVSTLVPATAGGAYLDTWNFQPNSPPNGGPMATALELVNADETVGNFSVGNNTCMPFTVRGKDGSNRAMIPNGTTLNFIPTIPNTAVYDSSSCATQISAYTTSGNGTDQTFYYMRSDSGTANGAVFQVSSSLGTAQTTYNFRDRIGNQPQVRVLSPSSIYSQECFPVNLQSWDITDNMLVNFLASSVETYLPAISGLNFYFNGDCTGTPAGSSVWLGAGVSSLQLFAKYIGMNSTLSMTPPGSNPSIPLVANSSVTVNQPGPASKIQVRWPSNIEVGQCVTVDLLLTDNNGHPSPSMSAPTFTLSSTTGANDFKTAGCMSPTSAAAFSTTDTLQRVFLQPSTDGAHSISVSDGGSLNTQVNLTVWPASFNRLVIALPGQTYSGGAGGAVGTASPMSSGSSYQAVVYLVRPDNTIDTVSSGNLMTSLPSFTNLSSFSTPSLVSFSNGFGVFSFTPTNAGTFDFNPVVRNPNTGASFGMTATGTAL